MAHHHHAGHSHRPDRGGVVDRSAERSRLRLVLMLTGGFMVVEAVAGFLANSLALVADAGHMFTDAGALALALVAMHLAQLPASDERTYGYVRTEVLAALVNGAALIVISLFIFWEAWDRLRDPVTVDGPLMMVVASIGLVVNIVGAWLLHSHAGDNLNLKGAYLHIIGDLLGSIGALTAGAVILFTGWMPADPIISAVIGLLILVSAWRLVRDATDVLMEAAPRHVDVADLRAELNGVPGLSEVHHMHVWTLTSGLVALSGHGVIDDPMDQRTILDVIHDRVQSYGIECITFQLEPRTLLQISTSTPDAVVHRRDGDAHRTA